MVGLYIRLSRLDDDLDEYKQVSNSVENQRKLLTEYLDEVPDLRTEETEEFVDDGWSGTNFQRPAFQRMLALIKKRTITTVIVKDFSRFGRNYVECADYLEKLFPFLGTRFISVADNYDSGRRNEDKQIEVAMKNIVNSYLCHRDEILKRLRLKKINVFDENGKCFDISDVELIYGDPFNPTNLNDDFWWRFEDSLAHIDATRINAFFGKENKDLKEMAKCVDNARRILMEAFASWIGEIQIGENDVSMRFGENCYFINFNYTYTLEKRFAVEPQNVCHIHGEADDPKSIIVGHTTHPQQPIQDLYRMGGRFRGLYQIEDILYRTDKHVRDNITLMTMEMSFMGIFPEDIKNVYVLGHSFGNMDIEYFDFINQFTSITDNRKDYGIYERFIEGIDYMDPLDDFNNRIQYVIKRYGTDTTITDEISPEEKFAVLRRFEMEQEARDSILERDVMKMIRKASMWNFWMNIRGLRSKKGKETLEEQLHKREQDAMWHISYFSQDDKTRIEKVMDTIGCDHYEMVSSIDEAIKPLISNYC